MTNPPAKDKVKSKRDAWIRSSDIVLRLCPNCKDLTAEPAGAIDEHRLDGQGAWQAVTIMQLWQCPKCKHEFAEWKPPNTLTHNKDSDILTP